MSEPKRYYLWAGLECHAFSKAEAVLKFSEEEDGMWVQYQDYARLKAEVEAVTQEYRDATNHYNKLHNELQAEVERLRKAGDDLEFLVCFNHEGNIKADKHSMNILDARLAAKEGKQP